MKQRFEAVSRPYRLLIILGLVFISTIATSYSIYEDQQQKIEENLKVKQGIKQDIRTLFESINPELLREIDAGQKKILTTIGTPNEITLSKLSERVDFDKYLSFKQITYLDESNDLGDPNIVIDNGKYLWMEHGYYLYPKDALIK